MARDDEQSEERRSIAGALSARRAMVGMSQAELGKLAGVHRGTVRNAEAGRTLEPSTLSRLALSLGCVPRVHDGEATLKPVFSAPTTRVVTRAILAREVTSKVGDEPIDLDDLNAEFHHLADYWRTLVAEMSNFIRNVPSGFDDFRAALAEELPPSSVEAFDRELNELLEGSGGGKPVRNQADQIRQRVTVHLQESADFTPSDPRALVWRAVELGQIMAPDAMRILAADADITIVRFLVDYAAKRRALFETQFADELGLIIERLAPHLPGGSHGEQP